MKKQERFIQKIETHVNNFFLKLQYENKSTNTIDSYRNVVDNFVLFLKTTNIKSFKDIKPSTLYSFLKYKEQKTPAKKKLSAGTKQLTIIILQVFFHFIEIEDAEDLLSFDRLFSSIKIKQKKRQPKGLNEEEIKRLMHYLNNVLPSSFVTMRNRLIIKCALFGGLRISEILSLKFQDFKDVQQNSNNEEKDFNTIGCYEINIIGKGDKQRTVYIAHLYIKKEIDYLLKHYCDIEDYICKTQTKSVCKRTDIDTALRRYCKYSHIPAIGMHALRHTFAKNFLNNNGNIIHLQHLLGHSDIKTTMVYTTPHQEDIKRDYRKTVFTSAKSPQYKY